MKYGRFSLFSLAVTLVLSSMFFLLISSFGGPGEAFGKNTKIGFILKTMQEERYRTDKALFMARAESLGAEVLFDSSSNNELTQLRQVEKMLDEGIDVLVLQPVNTGTAGNLVNLAHAKGVRVVGYDSMLQNGPLDFMVMQDSWSVGKLQGQAMLAWLKQKKGKIEGKVVLIMGQPGDSNAAAMSSGVLEIIKNNGELLTNITDVFVRHIPGGTLEEVIINLNILKVFESHNINVMNTSTNIETT